MLVPGGEINVSIPINYVERSTNVYSNGVADRQTRVSTMSASKADRVKCTLSSH